jgi:hypothetical protein
MKIKSTVTTIMCVCLTVFGCIQNSWSQESKRSNKIEFKSFSFSAFPLDLFFNENGNGASMTLDISLNSNKDIFTFLATGGSEISVLGGGGNTSFEQLNLMYGREMNLAKNIFIDLHAGVGYVSYKFRDNRNTTIGVPLMAKLRFKTGERFSIGLRLLENINSSSNVLSTGILFQWNY